MDHTFVLFIQCSDFGPHGFYVQLCHGVRCDLSCLFRSTFSLHSITTLPKAFFCSFSTYPATLGHFPFSPFLLVPTLSFLFPFLFVLSISFISPILPMLFFFKWNWIPISHESVLEAGYRKTGEKHPQTWYFGVFTLWLWRCSNHATRASLYRQVEGSQSCLQLTIIN